MKKCLKNLCSYLLSFIERNLLRLPLVLFSISGFLLIVLILYNSFPQFAVSSYREQFKFWDQIEKPSNTGEIGDTIGGTLGPIVGLIAAFFTGLAFWAQYRANEQQKEYIRQQRFEDTFFRLLENHQKIVDSIDIRSIKDRSKITASGRECFKNMYKNLEKKVGLKKDIENIDNCYNQTQEIFKHDLHHYFRFLYHMLKFIKHADIDEDRKFKYSCILRATLSAYELTFIFYNGLHPFGNSHFKPLLEEFSFLKNMDDTLLFNEGQKGKYHDIAFANSSKRESLLPDWKYQK